MKKNIYRIALLLLGILTIVLFFAPTLVKNYVVKNSKELVGTQIEINKLKYNYFTSTLNVYNFKMFERGSAKELITWDTLLLNIAPLKLLKNKLGVEQLYVGGLNAKAALKDSTYNFDSLLEFYSKSDTTTTKETEENSLEYSISNIEFKHSDFLFNNQDVESKLELQDISFAIPNIAFGNEEETNGTIKLNFENGGSLESTLNLNAANGDFNADVVLDSLNVSPFYKYILDYANINSLKGLLSSNLYLNGNINSAIETIVSGKVNVHDFEMTDTDDKKILGSNLINAQLQKIDYAHNSYEIDSISLKTPYVYFSLDSITNNLFRVFKLYPEETIKNIDSTSTVADSNLFYKINHLEINKGVLDYRDNLTGKTFDYHLSDIKMNSNSISSTSEMLDVTSKMLLNNRGTLDAHIRMDPSDFMNGTTDFRIENFLLSDINVYSDYYMGHNIVKGDFYYYSHSDIIDGKIKSTNKLLVKNVSVKSERKGLYQLPLKFALFLLKDKDGNVNLDIPVRGDLNDPKINIRKLVWSAFKNLIIKAVASPVNFLGGLVNGDPKELTAIKFNYLDTILSNKQKKKLDKLIDLEYKKEGLKIDLIYVVDEDLQEQEIAKTEVDKIYFKEAGKHYLKDKENFKKYASRKTGIDSLNVEQSVIKLSESLNLDAMSKKYSDLRIKKTKAYLKSKNDFTQIKIKQQDSLVIATENKHPKFDIKYSIQ